MVALYITSIDNAGRTTLCAGIGKKLLAQSRKIGFIVPVQIFEDGKPNVYEDVDLIKELFGLRESREQLSPNCISRQSLQENLAGGLAAFTNKLKQDYAKVSKGREVVIMEGLSGFGVDRVATQASYTIAEVTDAKVIILMRYSPTAEREDILKAGKKLGDRLLGVVINFVPDSRMPMATESARALFGPMGVRVLGIIPEVRNLLGISVKEIVDSLGGEVLTAKDRIDGIVENVMLGAMSPDSGIDYFSRKINKAAVIRSERADMQLAALETSSRCLVIAGNEKPLQSVVNQAEDKHVPIVLVKDDTSTIIRGIETILTKKSSYNTPQRLQEFENILSQHLDFKALYSLLGLQA